MGDIIVNDDISVTDTLKGEKIILNGVYNGMFTIVDSLIFFWHPGSPDFQYYCFDLKTGESVCNFIHNGRGPQEFINVTPIIQVYEENGEKKSLFVAVNESQVRIFNITKSIDQRKTILDSIISFNWRDEYTQPFINIFKYDETISWLLSSPRKRT